MELAFRSLDVLKILRIRVDRIKRHKLFNTIVMAICAVVAGADRFDAIKLFATAHEQWLSRFLELPNGIPTQHRFERVFVRKCRRRSHGLLGL
jgi:DDE_Tnp_1-associated